MKFSICIPNYNYGKYIGKTIQSVLDQDYGNFEIVIADNQSTDRSWDVIQAFVAKDKRVRAFKNVTNLGFAGNLDAVSSKAEGDWQLLVSSDDVMNRGALDFYAQFLKEVRNTKVVFSSACAKIDSEGRSIGYVGPREKLWKEADIDGNLSEKFNCKIYKVGSGEMLKRCLLSFYGPFNFVSTCYPSDNYLNVGGYGGSRMYNPDKWFHWRLLAFSDYAYYIDSALFSYRWHQSNQAALQRESGALKFWVDEYRNSFEPDEFMLKKSGLSRSDLVNSYCLSILKYIYFALKRREFSHAVRLWHWANACYPKQIKKHRYYWLLASPIQIAKLLG